MRIAFHSNQLSIRGTETAMYDYADYNEKLLSNSSIIVTPKLSNAHDELAAQKFAARFPIHPYSTLTELDKILAENNVDILYCIKSGKNDGIVSSLAKTVIHSVFGFCEPHGDVYAYVSRWLAENTAQNRFPWVPHIVTPLPACGDLREQLAIPKDAIVFGRHGGADTFDIPFAHAVVKELVKRRADLYFVFLGTNQFCDNHPQIIHLNPSTSLELKSQFIASCDAMLHARNSGETFGLAIAEFSSLNKPVITFSRSLERAHIEILGENAFYYDDAESLTKIIWTFEPAKQGYWRMYADQFKPQDVMQKFFNVFIAN